MKHSATHIEGLPSPASGQGIPKLALVGGLFGAIAASTCCILPLALFGIGVSGAWIGNLTRLAPYQPYFIAFAVTNIGYGAWRVYKARQTACEPGSACARPVSNRFVTFGLVMSAVLVAAAVSFNFVAPLLLGS